MWEMGNLRGWDLGEDGNKQLFCKIVQFFAMWAKPKVGNFEN